MSDNLFSYSFSMSDPQQKLGLSGLIGSTDDAFKASVRRVYYPQAGLSS